MNACTFVFILIFYQTIAYQEVDDYSNLGSVLFSPSDIRKKTWSEQEINLLRARQYFQSVIPPLQAINTLNEDYVDTLLRYFRDTYSSIKEEAADPETDGLMTRALSDAIGGYLKVWVLPITKFAYYGGTVSQDNALKLHDFYDGIKKYLNTDGNGWRCPDANILNSIAINIAPLKMNSFRRANRNACDNLAFFENTSSGFVVPIPHVNWQDESSTMFVPLKTQSLLSLNSPNSSDTLFEYYDTAKNCIQMNNLDDQINFEERFQSWLAKDIMPHLKDEYLYLALGSVLTLVNDTKNLFNVDSDKSSPIGKTFIAGIPIDFSSKKIIIISVIIFLEVVWCIPALLYILCSKNKKSYEDDVFTCLDKKNSSKDKMQKASANALHGNKIKTKNVGQEESPCTGHNIGLFGKKASNSKNQKTTKTLNNETCTCEHSKSQVNRTIPCVSKHRQMQTSPKCSKVKEKKGITLRQKPRGTRLEVEAMFSTSSSKHSMGTGTRSYFCSQIYNPTTEAQGYISTPRNSQTKRKDDETAIRPVSHPSREICCCILENGSETCSTVQEVETTKTVTILKEVKKHQECTDSADEKDSTEVKKRESTNKCIYVSSCRECQIKGVKSNNTSHKASKTSASRKEDSKARQHKPKGKKGANNPHLEITIDKFENKSISVDITESIKPVKPSKIPKRAYNSSISQTFSVSSKRTQDPVANERRSYKSNIPQPKKRAFDDTAVTTKSVSVKDKLNTTF